MPTPEWIEKGKVINHQNVPYRVLERQYHYGAMDKNHVKFSKADILPQGFAAVEDAAAYPEGRNCRKHNAGDKFHDAEWIVALFADLVGSKFGKPNRLLTCKLPATNEQIRKIVQMFNLCFLYIVFNILLSAKYGKRYDSDLMKQSYKNVAAMLGREERQASVWEQIQQSRQKSETQACHMKQPQNRWYCSIPA